MKFKRLKFTKLNEAVALSQQLEKNYAFLEQLQGPRDAGEISIDFNELEHPLSLAGDLADEVIEAIVKIVQRKTRERELQYLQVVNQNMDSESVSRSLSLEASLTSDDDVTPLV